MLPWYRFACLPDVAEIQAGFLGQDQGRLSESNPRLLVSAKCRIVFILGLFFSRVVCLAGFFLQVLPGGRVAVSQHLYQGCFRTPRTSCSRVSSACMVCVL